MNPFRAWQELDYSERIGIVWTMCMVLMAVVIVLYAIAASRGQDVDYFKHRLGLMEQRMNYMDQKLDTINARQVEQRDNLNEVRRMLEAEQRLSEEQQKWIEHWKTLPQLPRPPARR
jgi:hypothetical protein